MFNTSVLKSKETSCDFRHVGLENLRKHCVFLLIGPKACRGPFCELLLCASCKPHVLSSNRFGQTMKKWCSTCWPRSLKTRYFRRTGTCSNLPASKQCVLRCIASGNLSKCFVVRQIGFQPNENYSVFRCDAHKKGHLSVHLRKHCVLLTSWSGL